MEPCVSSSGWKPENYSKFSWSWWFHGVSGFGFSPCSFSCFMNVWLSSKGLRSTSAVFLCCKKRTITSNEWPQCNLSIYCKYFCTSRAGPGTKGPALQGPLVGFFLDHVVVVDWDWIFMDDVFICDSRTGLVVFRYNLKRKQIILKFL